MVVSACPPGGSIRRGSIILVGLAFALQLAVIWSVTFPPQHDTPGHMARHFLEAQHLFGGEVPPVYEVQYRLLPNLGGDLVMPPLMALVEPVLAAKIFLSLAVVLYWLGPALFIWQYGGYRLSGIVPSLLLLPFTFSSAFFWGFLNFYTSVGLAFVVLFHFGVVAARPQPRIFDLVLHALLVTLLFFWHLAGFAIYGIVMAAQVATRAWQRYRKKAPIWQCIWPNALLGLPALPAIGLFALYSSGKTVQTDYWAPLWQKLLLPLYLFRTYDVMADLTVAALWLGACLALFLGRQSLRKQEPWLWTSMAGLVALTLAVPTEWGSVFNADARFMPALLVCIVCLGTRLRQRRLVLAAALLVAGLFVRYGSVHVEWTRLDQRLQRIATAFALFPPGSRVMPFTGGYTLTKNYPETLFISWAIPLRAAYVPTVFAYEDQQPLRLKLQLPIHAKIEGEQIVVDSEAARADYDFIWIFNPRRLPVRISADFTKVFSEEDVTVWRAPPRPGDRVP
jgi:hypothetical protein